jgi:hypothetical protein
MAHPVIVAQPPSPRLNRPLPKTARKPPCRPPGSWPSSSPD